MSLFPILRSNALLQRHCYFIRRSLTSTPAFKTAPSKYIIGGVPQDYCSEEAEDDSPGISNRYFGPKSNFVDFKHIQVVGGRGGDGAVSFLRDKITSDGPPNGGNGGNGGNVVLKASRNESTLSIGQYRCSANRGLNGLGSSMHGQRGADLVITVPVGTVVREVDAPNKVKPSSEKDAATIYAEQVLDLEVDYSVHYRVYPSLKRDILHFPTPRAINKKPLTKICLDLDQEGSHVVAYGGRGGYGNPHFSSQNERSALIAERGFEGETRYLELEFKSLADCGMVGLPNAGKSTFLGAVSNAHPKIAPYPFTTINPYLGTIDYPDLFQMTLADIPGLIPGAHLNRGLGHAFLRHVERSKALVYVVDLSLPTPHLDFQTLRSELELYKSGLSEKPSLIVANKADLPTVGPHTLHEFKSLIPSNIQVIPVSAKLGKNVSRATLAMRRLVESSN